jgi:serine phosphatase RsbU (regulator of sigma subunit)
MVGGDFYDIFTLDGRRNGLVISYVSDKGIPSTIPERILDFESPLC